MRYAPYAADLDTSRIGTRDARGLPATPRPVIQRIPLRMKDAAGRPLYVDGVTYAGAGTKKARKVYTGAVVSLKRQARRDRARRTA